MSIEDLWCKLGLHDIYREQRLYGRCSCTDRASLIMGWFYAVATAALATVGWALLLTGHPLGWSDLLVAPFTLAGSWVMFRMARDA